MALLAVAAAAALLGVLWPLGASGHTARTFDSKTFTDPSGDNRVGGPDLTTVQVSDDSSAKITFTATIANRPSLTDVDAVQAFFDTDKNAGTGGNGGFEYEVAWLTGHEELDKWDGSQFATQSPPASFSASYKNGQATFSIGKDDFGGSAAFDLVVTTTGDVGDSTSDRGPDGGTWGYPTGGTVAPPPPPPPPPGSPPPPPPPSGVKLIAVGFTVAKPHSGRPFTVAMVVRVKQTGIAVRTTVSCSATLAGKRLQASKKGSVRSGRASCTWRLPKHSKGKQLKGSITATYRGAKIKKSFSKAVFA